MDTQGAPERFLAALHALKATVIRPEIELIEVPAPKRAAPFAVAIDGSVIAGTDDVDANHLPAEGTFLLLYDPEGQTGWESDFRVVTYVEADLNPVEARDPLVSAMAWTWVVDALGHVPVRTLSGTVSIITSASFGGLQQVPNAARVEIRASWSPTSEQVGSHLAAWMAILATAGGLEQVPSDVTLLDSHRDRHAHRNSRRRRPH
ncbi:MAG: DUF3000 domain-containing protein [Promicromonosporaceae bacterium]|nr:DUF3000 domain-containing protein [Promicromonosporaceae bacterium]